MLVITRKPGEVIYINETIRVVIVDVKGDRVRIGIEADKDVPILRGELKEKNDEV